MAKLLSICLWLVLLLFGPLEGSWSAPTTISSLLSDSPDVKVDASGNAVAVWKEFNGFNYVIQMATAPYQSAWSVPIALSDPGEDAFFPHVALGPGGASSLGNAVVWSRFDGAFFVVQATDPVVGTPEDISVGDEDAIFPQVAADPAGNSVAIWMKKLGINYVIQVAERYAGIWSMPITVSSPADNSLQPIVKIDALGNAVAAWVADTGSQFVVQTATRAVGSSWTSAQTVSSLSSDAFNPQIGIDGSGNATVVWTMHTSTEDIIQAVTKPLSGAWSSPQNISTGLNAFLPQIAVDPQGNAVVVWEDTSGTQSAIQAVTRIGGSWSSPVYLSSGNQNALSPQVSVDASGNAVASWKYNIVASSKIQAALLPFGGVWTAAADISTSNADSEVPSLAMNARGDAIIGWRDNSSTTIEVSFDGFYGAPLPPLNPVGAVSKSQFLNKTVYYITITWNASPSENVAYYAIYKNNQRVQTIPATALLRYLTKIESGSDTNFEIASVGTNNIESIHIAVRIVR